MSTNAIIWLVFGAAIWVGSYGFVYWIGWMHGNTAGVTWARVQIYGTR